MRDEPAGADTVFTVLSNRRRRCIISLLADESPRDLRDIAAHIAAFENDTTVARVDSKDRQSVYVNLYQNHAPSLCAANIASYDAAGKSLSKGPQFDCAYRVLQTAYILLPC